MNMEKINYKEESVNRIMNEGSADYADILDECLKILYFHQNEYDGIQWAIREIEELKEMERE